MREYIVVYTYTGNFADTYHIGVLAKNYGEVELRIRDILLNGVEMTRQEAKTIDENDWYYIITLADEEFYSVEDAES